MKTLRLIGVNLLVLLVLLVVADIVIGIVKNKRKQEAFVSVSRSVLLKEVKPNQDVENTPNDEYIKNSENLEQKPYRIRTDSNGFITGGDKRTGPVDIIFFGGSTTECLFVEEDKRFPYLVGETLHDSTTGRKLNVLNSGVSGNHTLHSLINLLAKGIPLKPRVVVLMENINDLSLLTKTGTYWNAPQTRAIVQETSTTISSETQSIGTRLKGFSGATGNLLFPNIYNSLKARLSAALNKKPAKIDEWEGFRGLTANPDYEDIKRQYRSSLKSFVSIAKSWDIDVVLMTQFNRMKGDSVINSTAIKDNKAEFTHYYAEFNDIIRQVATEEKLCLIDLDKMIPSDSTCIYDAVHLNNHGSILAAKIISEHLNAYYPFFQ